MLLSRNETVLIFHPALSLWQTLVPAAGPNAWKPIGVTLGTWQSSMCVSMFGSRLLVVEHKNFSAGGASGVHMSMLDLNLNISRDTLQHPDAPPSWIPVHQTVHPTPIDPSVELAAAVLNATWVILLAGDAQDVHATATASVGGMQLASTQNIQGLTFVVESTPREVYVGLEVHEQLRVKVIAAGDALQSNHDRILVRIWARDVATGKDVALIGTTSVLSERGVASFQHLRVYSKAGTWIVFRAKAFGVAETLSTECAVLPGPVARMLEPLSLNWLPQIQPQVSPSCIYNIIHIPYIII